MNELNTLGSMGFALPSPAYLFGALLFSIVGWAAYRYGKKTSTPNVKWIGIGLMLYPYFISRTWALYVVGTALCAAMYFLRD